MRSSGIVFEGELSFIEPSATALYDLSRFGNNGAFRGIGEPDWVRLPSGLWVMNFDGTDDDVDCGLGASLNFGDGDFTLEVWFNTSVDYKTRASNGTIIAKGSGGPGGKRYNLIFWDNDNQIYFEIDDNTVLQSVIGNAGEYNDGVCHLLHAMRDGTDLRLYMDGAEHANSPTVMGAYGNIDNVAESLWLGGFQGTSGFFGGYLAPPRVCNYALSAGQVLNRYNAARYLFGV